MQGEEVIRGIDLDIQPGEKIAIVGATGAGKSTLINLLSRFYEFEKGEICLDDHSINDFRLQSLRKHVGYCPTRCVFVCRHHI